MNDTTFDALDSLVGVPLSELEQAVNSFQYITDQKKRIDEELKRINTIIKAYAPEDIGQHAMSVGGKTVTIKRQEKFDWDQKKLAALVDSGTLPAEMARIVEQSCSVNKAKYKRLSKVLQDSVKDALTISPGSVTISVD